MANTHSLDLELSSSQYASITDAAQTGLDITGDISIEFWMKLEQLPSTAGTSFVIVSKSNAGSSEGYTIFLETSNDKIYARIDSDDNGGTGTRTQVSADTALDADDLDTWIHIAVTIDVSSGASGITIYKDTVSQDTSTGYDNATSINDSSAPFIIGARQSAGSEQLFFDGKLDEVRVWNDVRTSGEISSNYQRELQGDETGLVGYWKFNGLYTDATSNSNDLTASGSPVFAVTDVPFDDLGGSFLFNLI